MLNPSDITNMKFDKVMGRGYKVDDVESYLRQVAGELAALHSEKQDLEQKLMVLAEKLEEYKHDEESLRSALIGAQKLGDSVIRDAKAKAGQMLEDADARANLLMDNARRTIEREQKGYVRLQREVATFKSKLQLMYKQHLELVSSIPADESLLIEQTPPPSSIPEPIQPQESASNGYMKATDYTLSEQPYEMEGEPPEDVMEYDDMLPEDSEDADYLDDPDDAQYSDEYEGSTSSSSPVHDSRFGPLKFGKEYSITRNDKRKK